MEWNNLIRWMERVDGWNFVLLLRWYVELHSKRIRLVEIHGNSYGQDLFSWNDKEQLRRCGARGPTSTDTRCTTGGLLFILRNQKTLVIRRYTYEQ